MKKLFFTALVAVVAVGGAYAQQYTYINGATTINFDCAGGPASCEASLPSGGTVFQNTPSGPVEINRSQLPQLEFQQVL